MRVALAPFFQVGFGFGWGFEAGFPASFAGVRLGSGAGLDLHVQLMAEGLGWLKDELCAGFGWFQFSVECGWLVGVGLVSLTCQAGQKLNPSVSCEHRAVCCEIQEKGWRVTTFQWIAR